MHFKTCLVSAELVYQVNLRWPKTMCKMNAFIILYCPVPFDSDVSMYKLRICNSKKMLTDTNLVFIGSFIETHTENSNSFHDKQSMN